MEVNIDDIEKQNREVEQENKKKEQSKQKEQKSVFKMVKNQRIAHNPMPNDVAGQVSIQNNGYLPTEWGDIAQSGIYKILSLPAGEDAAEFEQRLRESRDITNLINENNFVFDFILNKLDPKLLYGLSYGAILADVKVKNRNKMKKLNKEISNSDVPKVNNITTKPFIVEKSINPLDCVE